MKANTLTKTFSDLGLPASLVDSLAKAEFTVPTKIQAEAIPPQLAGRDILGIAQTGSGKTAAFGLPILTKIFEMTGFARPMTARALILAPTRELAVQIEESLRKFAGMHRLSTVLVLGGVSRHHQVGKLAKGVDILIATPGRLKDLVDDKKVQLNETRFLVLDEADRMLDMGFIGTVREIAGKLSHRRQTALFSATMAPEIAKLAAGLLNDPVRVEASPAGTTVAVIDQRVILAGTKAKRGVLNELLADSALERVIIFSRTKHGADRVAKNLAIDGHQAAAIHGNKSQNARQAALKGFSSGAVRILVATDIAARGIDVPGISHVINYELPDDAENYVHRIGRTGRNGASGSAITLCASDERAKLRDVERLIRRTLPYTGDLHTANETGVVEAPHSDKRPSQPRGGRPSQGRGAPRTGQQRSSAKPVGTRVLAGFGDGQVRHDAPQAHRTHAPAKPRSDADGQRNRAKGNGAGFAGLPGSGAPGNAGAAKPRWNKGQKDAGRSARSDNRSGRGNVA